MRIPTFDTAAVRAAQAGTNAEARQGLLSSLDRALRARVELLGLPDRTRQKVVLLEPGRAPHVLWLDLRTCPTVEEAEPHIRALRILPDDARILDSRIESLVAQVFVIAPREVSCKGGGFHGHASIPTPLGRRAVPAHKGPPADGFVKARIASLEAGIQATHARDRPHREEDGHPDRQGSGSLSDGHGRCSDAAPVNMGQPSCGPKLGKGDVSFPVSLEAALAGHADLLSVHALTLLVQRWSVSPPWTLELEWPKAPLTLLVQRWSVSPPWTLELEWPKAPTKSSALALLDHVPWKDWEPPSSPIELFIYADGSVMRNSHGAAFVVFTQEPGGLGSSTVARVSGIWSK
eukprot:s24_g8.t1